MTDQQHEPDAPADFPETDQPLDPRYWRTITMWSADVLASIPQVIVPTLHQVELMVRVGLL